MLKVMIVDDDDIVLLVQSKMLQRCEISENPLKFKSARAALNYLCENASQQKFLIFLDINMPEMSGWDFLNKMEAINLVSNCRVIMVTSSIDLDDKEKAESYTHVIDYIEKPISSRDCDNLMANPFFKSFKEEG